MIEIEDLENEDPPSVYDPDTRMRITVNLRTRHIVALDRTCADVRENEGQVINRNELMEAVFETADLGSAAKRAIAEKYRS